MNSFKIFLAAFTMVAGLFGSQGFASEFRFCSSYDQKTVLSGVKCVTSQGHEFVRYYNSVTGDYGWVDLSEGGVIWYDLPSVIYKYNFFDANNLCSVVRRLQTPTMAEYQLALDRGLQEVYPELNQYRKINFWTSTLYSQDHRQGIALSCRKKNNTCEFVHGHLDNQAYVRCMSRR